MAYNAYVYLYVYNTLRIIFKMRERESKSMVDMADIDNIYL